MEQMTQELSMDNHNLKTIKKLYNDSTNGNTFLNAYTMLDVEDGKKHLFSYLMKNTITDIPNTFKTLWKNRRCC